MIEFPESICSICKLGQLTRYKEHSWDYSGVRFSLAICSNCESVMTNPLPSAQVISEFYGTSYDYRWFRDHYDAKIKDCKMRIEEYQPILGGKILDFGGGLGYFSEVARQEGYESATYDPFAGHEKLPAGKWDTIVALHVLEHTNNLDAMLELMLSLLETSGNILIAVPNFKSEGYRRLEMSWTWAQPPIAHIYHFTAEGLKLLLSRHGLKVMDVSYHDRWDANFYSDVLNVNKTNKRNIRWGLQPFNKFNIYRKIMASHNSIVRFNELTKSYATKSITGDQFSELQMIVGR